MFLGKLLSIILEGDKGLICLKDNKLFDVSQSFDVDGALCSLILGSSAIDIYLSSHRRFGFFFVFESTDCCYCFVASVAEIFEGWRFLG